MRRIDTDDPERTVAVEVTARFGPLLVYGTVLPWGGDPGPDATCPAKGWSEMDRLLPLQLAEWRRLRDAHPEVPLVVAGDLNMNLGGAHYYGTKRCRATLLDGIRELGLACATTTDKVPVGALRYPPIDHVLVPASWATRVVSAWEGTTPQGSSPQRPQRPRRGGRRPRRPVVAYLRADTVDSRRQVEEDTRSESCSPIRRNRLRCGGLPSPRPRSRRRWDLCAPEWEELLLRDNHETTTTVITMKLSARPWAFSPIGTRSLSGSRQAPRPWIETWSPRG